MALLLEAQSRVNQQQNTSPEIPVRIWEPRSVQQTMALESITDVIGYGGAAGGGKCLGLDTPIPTPEGWTSMGDLQAGDELFDESGNVCHVAIAHEIINEPESYEITFSDREKVKACADHKWSTESLKERTRQTNRTNLPFSSIKTTKEIFQSIRVQGRINHSIPVSRPIQCDKKDLLIDPYLLGCWLGDGSSYKAEMTSADDQILQAFSNGGFRVTHRADYTYGVSGGLLVNLRELSVLKNKHIPVQYLRSSVEQRIELLQGLMDTDGYCDPRGQCEFTTIKKVLADHVYELIISLGIKVTICEGWAKLNGRIISKKYRLKFLSDIAAFKLPRKLIRQKRSGFRGTHSRRYILDCKKIDSIPMRCITVDSPSKLYLCSKAMIPTHNTDLLLGASVTEHHRSIIYRKEYEQHSANVERMGEIVGTRQGFNNKMWRVGGRTIEFAGVARPGAEEKKRGQPHDLKGFDELTEFSEYVFRFLNGWKRTTIEGQRCRTIATFNPPIPGTEGEWVIRYFAPWLDPMHENPAKSGEIRWFAMLDDVETEVADGKEFEYTNADGMTETIYPESRTFIQASLEDNPYLSSDPQYRKTLQALPEPLRSMLLYGKQPENMEDHAWQVVPSAWIDAAFERWEKTAKPEISMSALGADVSRGGKDDTVLTPRFGNWFAEQIKIAGKLVPDGPTAAAFIVNHVQNMAPVMLDIIGIGSSVYDSLVANNVSTIPLNGANKAEGRDRSGRLGFVNKRAKWYWRFREALDPDNGSDLAIPYSSKLKKELCCIRWRLTSRGIQIESKQDIIARLHYSPDYADSMVYSLADIGIAGFEEDDFLFMGNENVNNQGDNDGFMDTDDADSVAESWGNESDGYMG